MQGSWRSPGAATTAASAAESAAGCPQRTGSPSRKEASQQPRQLSPHSRAQQVPRPHPSICHALLAEGCRRPGLPLRAVGAVRQRRNLDADLFFILLETRGVFFFSGKRLRCPSHLLLKARLGGSPVGHRCSITLTRGGYVDPFLRVRRQGPALSEDWGPGPAHRWNRSPTPDWAASQKGKAWALGDQVRPGHALPSPGQLCRGPRTLGTGRVHAKRDPGPNPQNVTRAWPGGSHARPPRSAQLPRAAA